MLIAASKEQRPCPTARSPYSQFLLGRDGKKASRDGFGRPRTPNTAGRNRPRDRRRGASERRPRGKWAKTKADERAMPQRAVTRVVLRVVSNREIFSVRESVRQDRSKSG
jgi:hypothetical protein